jgi:hypothetical protein
VSSYYYPESKTIDEVSFVKTAGGSIRAYLRADPKANIDTLHDVTVELAGRGWQCLPYAIDGKPLLEVRGFKSENQLLEHLSGTNRVMGTPQHTQSTEEAISFAKKIKSLSLGASGALYLLGDAAFSAYGYKGGSTLNTVGGALYGAGTLSLLVGGRKDQSDLQLRNLSRRMTDYIKEHGAQMPHDCSVSSILDDKNKTASEKVDELIRHYPSELMNMFFALAGVCIAASAYKYNIKGKVGAEEVAEVLERKLGEMAKKGITPPADFANKVTEKVHKFLHLEGILDIGLGAMTAVSGLFAASVKEKKRDPDAPPKEGAAGIWEKIQEKPLMIAGVGYMVSTMCHAVSTTLTWDVASNSRRQSVPFRAVFVGANLIAELLLAISSKGHGEGVTSDQSVDNSIISLAADLIVQQPAKLQSTLIDQVSGFLGQPNVLAEKDLDVRAALTQQVQQMRENPWAKAQKHENNKAHGHLETPVEEKATDTRPWQKYLARPAAQEGPALHVH